MTAEGQAPWDEIGQNGTGGLPGVVYLLTLVDVYHALPPDTLRRLLRSRGFGAAVDLQCLPQTTLAALAVHSHAPAAWLAHYTRLALEQSTRDLGPLMVDVPPG